MQFQASSLQAGKRIDVYLGEQLTQASRSRIQSWIKAGRVLIGGKPVRASMLLKGTEVIDVEPAEVTPLKAEAEELPLTVLYEDNDVVVIDKAPGMVVHAGAGHSTGTLVNALLHHFGSLSSLNGAERPGIVHRLDRDTSGLLLVARNDRAHQFLARQFHDRTVTKIYLALAHGQMPSASGRITTSITRDPIRRTRMSARLGHGRSALTEYSVLERLAGPLSFLRVSLGTGRTHQIRVHLASIGHPIFGDRLYGAPAQTGLDRFFLHAHQLTFQSPSTHKNITVTSKLPADLEDVLVSRRQKLS